MDIFEKRRETFMERMQGGIAVFYNGHELIRNNDTHYKFRPNSDFYYLTGFAEPDSVVVFMPNHEEHKYVMFVRPKDPERETWDGKRAGLEGALQDYRANASFDISELDTKLPELMKGNEKLFYTLGEFPQFDQKIINMITSLRRKVRTGDYGPSTITETGAIVHEMRLLKTEDELEIIRKANRISQEAHIEAMKNVRPGMFEFEIEALVENVFKKNGALSSAYGSIVGGGINATILHYVENNQKLHDGDLLLIDAGAEYGFYAGDITRTFPVNGKFTEPQKKVYEVVLRANEEAIKMVKPGVKFHDIHDRAVYVLTEGMVEIGLLKGDVETLIKEETYKKFYMHKTGHWLGMDVHDVGRYFVNGESRAIEPGMIMTIEPGLYIQENSEGVPEEYIGIGVRIEDDVLVTKDGYEILSAGVPKSVTEIEVLMNR